MSVTIGNLKYLSRIDSIYIVRDRLYLDLHSSYDFQPRFVDRRSMILDRAIQANYVWEIGDSIDRYQT